jgi:very-short-patch-repair endonuclease
VSLPLNEVDGSQHLDQQEYDAERTVYLEAHGYKVLRFGNGDVMNNIEGVLGVILEELNPSGTNLPDRKKPVARAGEAAARRLG